MQKQYVVAWHISHMHTQILIQTNISDSFDIVAPRSSSKKKNKNNNNSSNNKKENRKQNKVTFNRQISFTLLQKNMMRVCDCLRIYISSSVRSLVLFFILTFFSSLFCLVRLKQRRSTLTIPCTSCSHAPAHTYAKCAFLCIKLCDGIQTFAGLEEKKSPHRKRARKRVSE